MSQPKTIHLKDYTKPSYKLHTTNLVFDLHEDKALVTTTCEYEYDSGEEILQLFGEELKLVSFKVNGEDTSDYQLVDEGLEYNPKEKKFTLEIVTEIYPQKNLALMGLYKSGDIFCTQNEAEGFRRITYFYDRPDVLSKYTTKVIGDKTKYPFLLCNGNKIDSGDLENNRHWCIWEDPYFKPCYLFALVAGDFDVARDSYTTKSGRDVALEIYVDRGNLGQTDHAMESLKQSMKWDEDRFGLEYDLDIYMIVAVDSFNMGAMENKGLNIFNSAYVLGNMKTATDQNLYDIQAVIGHEYFHNWTGNRVTCRDWFQLTLKEGLTVFRDQEFSSDLNSRAVKRIDDVRNLRTRQFEEDAGPFAHPIKPKKYIEINNFYTLTVYEKGAEVIRMIQTIIGKENFEKGITKYFELFDGQAVRTEDFVQAMEIASGYNLSNFKKWYDVKGTPHLDVKTSWADNTFMIDLEQSFKNFDQDDVMSLPLNIKLIGESGKTYPIKTELTGKSEWLHNNSCLLFQDKKLHLKISDIPEKAYLSLNRGFSAPVTLSRNWNEDEVYQLLLLDDDGLNKWDYGQTIFKKNILDNLDKAEPRFDIRLVESIQELLKNPKVDNHFKAYFLTLPAEMELNESLDQYRFDDIHRVREALKNFLAEGLKDQLIKTYKDLASKTDAAWNADLMGTRALKNKVLSYLYHIGADEGEEFLKTQYYETQTMTDKLACLMIANETKSELTTKINEHFIEEWKDQDLVAQKWFTAQAICTDLDVLDTVKKLETSKYFNKKVPNHIYRLFGAFIGANLTNFHRADGEGYKYVVDKIIDIDSYNPQVASRMVRGLKNLKKLDPQRREKCVKELKRITAQSKISKDTFEVVSKVLQHQ